MSRYHGPQQQGAARQARTERRHQAEQRHAAERERDARRKARDAAPPRPLTDAERAELIEAARRVALAQWLNGLGLPWPVSETRTPHPPAQDAETDTRTGDTR